MINKLRDLVTVETLLVDNPIGAPPANGISPGFIEKPRESRSTQRCLPLGPIPRR